jgi:guanosine-3',5'-bis(diphosphate) 3'-pyrophosphohydrolase
MWTPLPGRFKDYIATPKPNMYQSLHTTVIGKGGEPFEVQVRTWEMHKTAEFGIAAHWKYKEGESASARKFDKKLAWLRSILEWQQDINDTGEFMESLKIDLFDDTVYVFTPKSDVFELPKGSCPVDFAYRVHTEVGHRCTGSGGKFNSTGLDASGSGSITPVVI